MVVGGGPDRVETHQDGAAGEERRAPEENIDIRVGVAGRRAGGQAEPPIIPTPTNHRHHLNPPTPPRSTSLREQREM